MHNRNRVSFVSAIKTAVELYKSQEKNGKLRMLILRLFQTKLISSKQLATRLKLLVPYLLSIQKSKDSMVATQSFFDYLFANFHLDDINVEGVSREYTSMYSLWTSLFYL